MKICSKCKNHKELDSFNRDKSTKDGLCAWCKDCRKKNAATYYERHRDECVASVAEWRAADVERSKASYRNSRYNLKPGRYEEILLKQGGKCPICLKVFGAGVKPHIDHDHTCCPVAKTSCGKCVRGILCQKCNFGLGFLEDSLSSLANAIAYLKGDNEHTR